MIAETSGCCWRLMVVRHPDGHRKSNDGGLKIGGSCDIVDCGPGRDCIGKDSRDVTRNCEIVL